VPADELTGRERAIMLALMAEARSLTNKELYERTGLKLDGAPRRRLNERKLVDSEKVRRSLVHELTDDGWRWCRAEMARPRPAGSGSFGGALYAVLAALDRHLVSGDQQLSDVFRPSVADRIRDAYTELAEKPEDWVRLSRLRVRLGDVGRQALDATLERMASTPGVHVVREPDPRSLSDEDREAAVVFGGDTRHMIMIEHG
jgi:hypothetical protein